MAKLNQFIAIASGIENKSKTELTEAYHALQKPALLFGIARTYKPKDEDGEKLPAENTLLQARVEDILKETAAIMTRHFDIIATRDYANCNAFADVVIDDHKILERVPVPYLLFIEKRLVDIHTMVSKLPTLDPSEQWAPDPATRSYASKVVETIKTKKIPRNHVKAEATQHHPAQVETFHEDITVGHWTTQKFSGAITAERQKKILDRVVSLQRAVKFAREHANSIDVKEQKVGQPVFEFLFAP